MKADKKNDRSVRRGGVNPGKTLPGMKEPVCESGIPLLGAVPWGTHFCQFYGAKQDLLDILVPYFAAGLKNNEFCMWITSDPLQPMEAERALSRAVPGLAECKRRGQIEILRHDQWYTRSGRFNAPQVLKGWLNKEAWALANGYCGLRAAGSISWLKDRDRRAFLDYERMVDIAIGEHRMLAICSYSLEKCPLPDIIEVLDTHEFALVRSRGAWRKVAGGRRRAEAALRESEARYRALFEASADGILIADLETRMFRYANPSICRMLGYSGEEILTLGVRDIHPKADLPSVIAMFEAQARGEIAVASVPCLRKDGGIFYADINTAKARIDGRECNIGIFRDITERLKAEDALKRTCADLEVERKLLQDKNIAFREAMNAVEAEKNKMKDEIIVNVNKIILPILKRVRLKGGATRGHLDLLEKSLGTLISSFGRRLTERDIKLTPKEIEISNMVKSGLTTKEISGLMNASPQTIAKHRNNIRKKLGLANKGVNLVSFLQSL
ncbi:MAG TPA: hypothetical protein DEQ38_02125 [Elusimicrobia bacterium]|nr:hypothetical protein [Elusimicrobiota bacterium]